MDKLIKTLIKERKVTIFLAIIVAFMGIYSYYILPRQESPDVSAPIAMIITPYPGASAEDINDLVTSKIEDELAELDGYDYVKSLSKDSVSIVIVSFDLGTEYNKAMQDVRNTVTDVKSKLPDGCMQSIVDTDLVETAGMIITLSGENYSYEQLASFGEQFKKKLTKIDGVSKFNVDGKIEKEVKVDVDIAKLNQIDLSLEDIYKLLKIQNLEIPSGEIKNDGVSIKVKTPGIYTSIKDIENTIIGVSPKTGIVTRLSDVANVYMDLEDGSVKYKQDGKNAVLLTGYFQDSKNVVLVGKEVRKVLDEIKSQLPKDIEISEVVYQPDDVSVSTNNFMVNLVEGIVFVVIIVLIGMGIRNALVVSAAIPLSILMTFIVMKFTGIKIHQMSLTALIIALGILVDNAIVISDAIQVRIDDGEEKLEAAYKGTSLSSIPIFTATLTTVAAFSPLMGIPGKGGQFLRDLPLVLIISIVAAYIVAMFVTPAMAAVFFAKSKKNKKSNSTTRALFEKTLEKSLKFKRISIVGVFVVLILVLKLVIPQLPVQVFPYVDKNELYINIDTEIASNIEKTEELTDKIRNILVKEQEVTSCTTAIGDGLPKFYITMKPSSPSKDYSQMLVKFDLEKENRRFDNNEEFGEYIQKLLDEHISAGSTTVKLLENAEPVDAKIIVRVSGDDMDRLNEISNQMQDKMKEIPGAKNVRDDFKDRSFEFIVDVDNDKASNMGISKYDIQRQVNIALNGSVASVYRRDGNEYSILVKSNITSPEQLENLAVKSSITENKIPIKQFATIGIASKIDTISRYERELSIQVMSDIEIGADPIEIENIIENDIISNIDLSGVDITFDGERESVKKNFSSVGLLAGFAIFIIYIILLVQFNSFVQPLVILITIPLSLIGSILGLYIFRQPLSFTAFLGIIALIGLVVKNGILLIEYINNARKEGHLIDSACIDAVSKRFNAIMLGTLTTVIGLLPLALSGSSLFAPMAVSLMSGLILATFLTLIVIPVIYSIIEGRVDKKKNRVKQQVIKG